MKKYTVYYMGAPADDAGIEAEAESAEQAVKLVAGNIGPIEYGKWFVFCGDFACKRDDFERG